MLKGGQHMKEKLTVKGFNFTDEEIEQLKAVMADTGMNGSQVIEQLIKKAFTDEKTRQIITKEFYWQRVQKSGRAPTSYNVHCVNEKKDGPNHIEPSAVSLNNQGQDTMNPDAWQAMCDRVAQKWGLKNV